MAFGWVEDRGFLYERNKCAGNGFLDEVLGNAFAILVTEAGDQSIEICFCKFRWRNSDHVEQSSMKG